MLDGDWSSDVCSSDLRFQRSAQTVGGTASGYSGRYFFDEVIENYYQIPARIEAIEKDEIVHIARLMFADKIWGVGILGGCGPEFTAELKKQLAPLWSSQLVGVL
jgi:hypothetical protein